MFAHLLAAWAWRRVAVLTLFKKEEYVSHEHLLNFNLRKPDLYRLDGVWSTTFHVLWHTQQHP